MNVVSKVGDYQVSILPTSNDILRVGCKVLDPTPGVLPSFIFAAEGKPAYPDHFNKLLRPEIVASQLVSVTSASKQDPN